MVFTCCIVSSASLASRSTFASVSATCRVYTWVHPCMYCVCVCVCVLNIDADPMRPRGIERTRGPETAKRPTHDPHIPKRFTLTRLYRSITYKPASNRRDRAEIERDAALHTQVCGAVSAAGSRGMDARSISSTCSADCLLSHILTHSSNDATSHKVQVLACCSAFFLNQTDRNYAVS